MQSEILSEDSLWAMEFMLIFCIVLICIGAISFIACLVYNKLHNRHYKKIQHYYTLDEIVELKVQMKKEEEEGIMSKEQYERWKKALEGGEMMPLFRNSDDN